jgi:hypothetical protein
MTFLRAFVCAALKIGLGSQTDRLSAWSSQDDEVARRFEALLVGMTALAKVDFFVAVDSDGYSERKQKLRNRIELNADSIYFVDTVDAFENTNWNELGENLTRKRRIDLAKPDDRSNDALIILYFGVSASTATIDEAVRALWSHGSLLVLIDGVAEAFAKESAWRRLARESTDSALLSDLVEGVRNVDFDLGLTVLGPTLATRVTGRLTASAEDFAGVRVGAPYAYALQDARPGIRTMMNRNETGMLHRLVAARFRGVGQVVDAGSFVGASSACLADALDERAIEPTYRVHAYDRFTNSDPFFDRLLVEPVVRHGSFLPEAIRNLQPLLPRVNIYPWNFDSIRWIGRPIEVFFADIGKSPTTNAAIYKEFIRYWMPGFTVYVQQDFVHLEAPWIQYTLASIIDRFCVIGVEAPSLYLGLLDYPTDQEIERIVLDDFDPLEKAALVEAMTGRFSDRETVRTLELIAARLAHDAHAPERAASLLDRCAKDAEFAATPRGRARIRRTRVLLGLEA